MRAEKLNNVTITDEEGRTSPCVQWVVSGALCAADKTDNSGRVVAHAVLHIEGHILLSITSISQQQHQGLGEHVAEG